MPDSSNAVPATPLFRTPGALAALDAGDVTAALVRHFAGDWGELCADDHAANRRGVREGDLRLLSVYRDRRGARLYVITEADRSATTVLLPDEY